jgi:hypothetical protein
LKNKRDKPEKKPEERNLKKKPGRKLRQTKE